ncbi:hypothetical protein WA026_017606 [Henosepilachna vigintioctopunctata]|uniref:Reverse transcriptase domain-containing protein n=1 Tax=Henosepilachna vigintioctopunctata TaxID=420089 RepID=A0AAW1V0M2_9CUCU
MITAIKNNIIVPNQSGFREQHSSESVVVSIADDLLSAIYNGSYVLAVFVDFKRAFETVDIEILLKKLENIGLRNKALNWFRSYMSNRVQRVLYKNCVSEIF